MIGKQDYIIICFHNTQYNINYCFHSTTISNKAFLEQRSWLLIICITTLVPYINHGQFSQTPSKCLILCLGFYQPQYESEVFIHVSDVKKRKDLRNKKRNGAHPTWIFSVLSVRLPRVSRPSVSKRKPFYRWKKQSTNYRRSFNNIRMCDYFPVLFFVCPIQGRTALPWSNFSNSISEVVDTPFIDDVITFKIY